jgi:hypothetical protein
MTIRRKRKIANWGKPGKTTSVTSVSIPILGGTSVSIPILGGFVNSIPPMKTVVINSIPPAVVPLLKRGRGRPKGSLLKRGRGRPKGSKNKNNLKAVVDEVDDADDAQDDIQVKVTKDSVTIKGANSTAITIPIIVREDSKSKSRPKLKVSDHEVILYRGDSTYIDKFEIGRTNFGSMLGRGIYLTDNIYVAESYRKKGGNSGSRYYDDLLCSHYDDALKMNKTLLNKCFESFWKRLDKDGNFTTIRDSNLQLGIDEARKIWEDYKKHLIIEKNISVDKYDIRLPMLPKDGYISTFKFPAHELLAYTLPYADNHKIGKDLAEKIVALSNADATEIIAAAVNKHILLNIIMLKHKKPWKEYLIEALAAKQLDIISGKHLAHLVTLKLGYLGWRYDGGKMLGGDPHNAFSLHDDDFVNYFRVS